MPEVDEHKLNKLMAIWVEHEFWIQAGCPDPRNRQLQFPGYGILSNQDVRGYGLYRHALVPYFAEALGYPQVHESLLALIERARADHPTLFAEMLAEYENPDNRFRAQWGNLFGNIVRDGLTHSSLTDYQAKYEVELPLCFLAQLREIVTQDTLDVQLQRFRDRNGSLRKGVLVQYIIDGLGDFPGFLGAIERGYQVRLRNAVGHNTYDINNGVLSSLDHNYRITEEEFREIFRALQIVQNAIVWFLMSRESDLTNLKTKGILGVGWDIENRGESEFPTILVFQLAPLYMLDTECEWLTQATLSVGDEDLTTVLPDDYPITGEMTPDIMRIVDAARRRGRLKCVVIPMMPCVHTHEAFSLVDGEYCQSKEEHEVEVVAIVVT